MAHSKVTDDVSVPASNMTYKKFTKLSIYNELGNTFMF
jgi:hypothetical protein